MLSGHRRQSREPPRLPGTLPALLRERGTGATRDTVALRFIDRSTESQATATYAQLWRRSAGVAHALARQGVRRGDAVLLLMESRLEFYYGLFAAMILGALPVAVYPPAGQRNLVPALDHLRKVIRQLSPSAILTSRVLFGVAEQVRQGRTLAVVTLEQLSEAGFDDMPGERVNPEEPILLQYTSGSLGDPKAIELSTRSIIANLTEIGDAFGMQEGDVGLSWLPLYHDMGLHSIFFNLMFTMPLVLMSPIDFLRHPAAWLRAISRFRVTHSPAPSFGYAFAARRVRDEDLAGVDLSTWRVAMCGAEPIDAEALGRFAERFERFGFRRSAFMGAYGLAENTVAVSFAPPGTGLRLDSVDAEALGSSGTAARPAEGGRALPIVSVGPPIQGHDVRIVDAAGREVADGIQGELQVRGPSRMLGYRGDSAATHKTFDGEWLRTGDLAYVRDGELFITGRIKDLIIRGGKNYHPQDIEAAAVVDGIRAGAVVAFGRRDPVKGTEDIVVVAEVKREENLSQPHLAEQVRKAISAKTGLSVSEIHLARPGAVPKTTSGKLRRTECRIRYESGRLEPAPKPSLWLLARVGVFNLLPDRLQRGWSRLVRLLRAPSP